MSQQPYQQLSAMSPPMHSPPMGGGAPGHMILPTLWPSGCGLTDRNADPEQCSTAPCGCCSIPVWYMDPNRQSISQQNSVTQGCCGWEIKDADVMGIRLSFRATQCGESCIEPEVHVSEGERPIGKTVMKMPFCACGDTVMAESFDGNGVSRFRRVENPCCPHYKYWSGDQCGWQEYNWPVYGPQGLSGPPLTYITYKYHCCVACHPLWVGVKQWPYGCSPDDQKLLLSMVHARWWRTEREQQQQRGGHGGGH